MTRWYRALLRLYPRSFREEFEYQLVESFELQCAEIDGLLAGPRCVITALYDVVPNAAASHLEILAQDIRFAWASLSRTPGFVAAALAVVALGVGANTAAFSVADTALLRPLPFDEPDQLVKVWQSSANYPQMELSPANYRDWHRLSSSFSELAAYANRPANLTGAGEPRRIETTLTTAELTALLRVNPLIGRTFSGDEMATGRAVLISHSLWLSEFGARSGAVGSTIRLDGTPYVIVGVMPPGFRFPQAGVDVWAPLVFTEADYTDRNNNYLDVIGRLQPRVSLERARSELRAVAARLERDYPVENKNTGATIQSLRADLSSRGRLLILALCGATLCILILACANLASLFLIRGAYREREMAVRSALGAGRDRLVRQMVTESLGVALIGGIFGVIAAYACLPLFARLAPEGLPLDATPRLDLRVLAIAGLLTVATGVAFGLVPALRAAGGTTTSVLRAGGRAGSRMQRLRAALVVVELAVSVVLVVAAGLLIRAVWRIQATDPGFVAENVLALRTALPLPKYDTVFRRAQYYTTVLNGIRAIPGVEGAAFATGLPMAMGGGIWPVGLGGEAVRREGSSTASLRYVTPEFLSTLRIPLRQGRDVSERDAQNSQWVAIVSESFARRYWPNESALGKRFNFAFGERTIAGVVGDIRVRGLEQASEPQVYLPYQQVKDGWLPTYVPKDIVIRSPLSAAALLPMIRRIVRDVDPEQPISHVRSLSSVVADQTGAREAQLRLLMALAAVAVLIAVVGVHGLLSFAVARRTREIGVRRALGASSARVVAMVLREGLVLAVSAATIGVILAYGAGRAMASLLFGVHPGDPVILGAAATLCVLAAIGGCILPAIRAAKVDPMAALQRE